MVSNSTRKSAPQKPKKKPAPTSRSLRTPTCDSAKEVKGRLHYFGPWENPQGAVEKLLE